MPAATEALFVNVNVPAVWSSVAELELIARLATVTGELRDTVYVAPIASMLASYVSLAVGEPLFGFSQILWFLRLILIPAFVVHILAAVQLHARARASRPRNYALRRNQEATFASRTMIYGGVFILLFVIYHVLDLTLGTVNPSFQEGNIYHNVQASFHVIPVVVLYVLAMIAVGLHLHHGIWSTFQTLGWTTSGSTRLIRNIAVVSALLLTVGNISIPIAVLTGIVK